jgi:hypothetical protein
MSLLFFLRKNIPDAITAKMIPAAIIRKYSPTPLVFGLGDWFVGAGVRVGMPVETELGLEFGLEVGFGAVVGLGEVWLVFCWGDEFVLGVGDDDGAGAGVGIGVGEGDGIWAKVAVKFSLS